MLSGSTGSIGSGFKVHGCGGGSAAIFKEIRIKSLSDFILGFLYRARRQGARIASYFRKMMTKLCIKTHMESDSAIESVFP